MLSVARSILDVVQRITGSPTRRVDDPRDTPHPFAVFPGLSIRVASGAKNTTGIESAVPANISDTN